MIFVNAFIVYLMSVPKLGQGHVYHSFEVLNVKFFPILA